MSSEKLERESPKMAHTGENDRKLLFRKDYFENFENFENF